MTDALDYGVPEAGGHHGMSEDDAYAPATSRFEDERAAGEDTMQMDADTSEAAAPIDRALRASPNSIRRVRKQHHMYEFPKELAVEAANNRGLTPLTLEEEEDPTAKGPAEPEIPPTVPELIGGPKDVRLVALHLTGAPISKLSTSRVFAFVSHFGAQPLGVEWIDDTSINVVFPTASAARLALEYLCPAVSMSDAPLVPLPAVNEIDQAAEQQKRYRQTAGQEDALQWSHSFVELLLLQRKCHRFPQRLLTGVEKDALSKAEELIALTDKPSEYPDDAPEIYRELEEQDRVNHLHSHWGGKIKDVKTLQGTIWARYAIESADVKQKQAKMYSKWYKEHGNDAGKQVVSKLIDIGPEAEKRELFAADEGANGKAQSPSAVAAAAAAAAGSSKLPLHQWGHIRSLGPAAGGSAAVRGRGAGRGQAVMDSLDDTMENLRNLRDGGDGSARRSASPIERRMRGGGRNYDAATLDDEMDSYNAARTSASPPASRASGAAAARDSSSFSRNGPGGRQGQGLRQRLGDDVMMDISSSAGGSGYSSSNDSGGGVRIKGRGRRKAPQPVGGGGGRAGMFGWDDDEGGSSGGSGRGRNRNDSREDLFAPPSRGGRYNRNDRYERHEASASSDMDGGTTDIFARAGIVRDRGGHGGNGRKRDDENGHAGDPSARVETYEEVGHANLLRKGGRGAGGFFMGNKSGALASRLGADAAGTDSAMSLGDRIQTEANEGAWDQ